MRALSFLVAGICLFAGVAIASPANPKNGAEYQTLPTPQSVQASGKKVEVIEFFMYHCPACNALEPSLAEWVKKHEGNIAFRRIHVPHTGENDPEAHLFLTLEALGIENEMHDKVLRAWHIEHHPLRDDNDNIDWAVRNGIDKAKFLNYYNSFSVMTKLKNLPAVAESYHVDSTPTFVVDGRYVTNAGMVDATNQSLGRENLNPATFQVVDALIAKSAK
jgi:thiol:disulfide interchange protein DsbA